MKQELTLQMVKSKLKKKVRWCERAFIIFIIGCILGSIVMFGTGTPLPNNSTPLFSIMWGANSTPLFSIIWGASGSVMLCIIFSIFFNITVTDRDDCIYDYFMLHLKEFLNETNHCNKIMTNHILLTPLTMEEYTLLTQGISTLIKEDIEEIASFFTKFSFYTHKIPIRIFITVYHPEKKQYDSINLLAGRIKITTTKERL